MATIKLHQSQRLPSDTRNAYKLLKSHNIDAVILEDGYFFFLECDVEKASEILADAGYSLFAVLHS